MQSQRRESGTCPDSLPTDRTLGPHGITSESRTSDSHSFISGNPTGVFNMDKNRTEGTKREIKGTIKEVTGKVTGNKSKEIAGNIEKNTGKVQKSLGRAADQMRDAARRRGSAVAMRTFRHHGDSSCKCKPRNFPSRSRRRSASACSRWLPARWPPMTVMAGRWTAT